MIWKDSFRLWKDYPLFGTGANAFRSVFSQVKSLEAPRSFNYAVNTYVQLLVEAGVLGFLLFSGLLVAYVKKLFANFKLEPKRKELIICVIGAIVAAMLHATVDLAPYILLYSVVLASMAGLALFRGHKKTKTRNENMSKFALYSTTNSDSILTDSGKTMRYHATLSLVIVMGMFFKYRLDIDQLDKSSYIISASPQELAKGLVFSPTSCPFVGVSLVLLFGA